MPRWRSSKPQVASPWSQSGLSVQLSGLLILALVHSFFVPAWAGVALAVLVIWRWIVSRGRLRLPPAWLLLSIALGGVLLIFLYFRTLLGAEAGIAFVLWLAGCKALETKSPRDATGLSLLGLFLSFSLLLHKQDLVMTAAVAAMIWLFLWSMAADRLTSNLRASGRKTVGILMLQALPLTLILFLVLPRIPGPLWRMPATRPTYQTGVSPTMAPGSVANLTQSEAIAFRVRFVGTRPDTAQLYWRGPVMSFFDGYAWQPRHAAPVEATLSSASPSQYEMTLEPHPYAWIYPLDHAVGAPEGTHRLSDGQMVARKPIRQRQRYVLRSSLSNTLPLSATETELANNLGLPRSGNPQSRAWGEELQRLHPEPRERIRAVLRRFQNEGYRYTLQPPTLGRDWIDAFMFRTRLGFCEHFAGSMAYILRAAGVPARVVGGYLGGEENPLDDYLIVRQSDAHAWVEAWLDGQGWVRIDPTSFVAPARFQGLEQALPAEEARRLAPLDNEFLRQLRYAWDSGQNTWNQWVIGYDEQNRNRLLSALSNRPPEQTVILFVIGGLVASGLTIWLWQRTRIVRPALTPEQQEWQRLERWLDKTGLKRNPGEGPRDYLIRARDAYPEQEAGLAEFAAMYLRLRYGTADAGDSAEALGALRRRCVKTTSARRKKR